MNALRRLAARRALPSPRADVCRSSVLHRRRRPLRVSTDAVGEKPSGSAVASQPVAETSVLSIPRQPSDALRVQERWTRDQDVLKNCDPGKRQSVAALLSGGVDSSVALSLLRAAGHDVTAFYLKIWFQDDFENFWSSCPWEEDIRFATQVCDMLDVRLEIVPLTTAYWDRVVSKIVKEIKAGLTPNPDVLCNSRIKFGAFVEFLDQKKRGFDRVASGHYARVTRTNKPDGSQIAELRTSADAAKDQTYFLAQLSQEQLSNCIFPLGDLTKEEVRKLAAEFGLPTSERKDSQGICFLGKVRFNEFVERHLGIWRGLILEDGTRERLGFHDGYWFHTIGQRSGLKLSGGPWYVCRKDVRWNVVYVRRLSAEQPDPNAQEDVFECCQVHWIDSPPDSTSLLCKVRHGKQFYSCSVASRGDTWSVRLRGRDQGLASGQFAVFYEDTRCLGCGVIRSPAVMAASRRSAQGH